MKSLIFLCLLNITAFTKAAQILAIIVTPSYSHQLVLRPLWRELSLRGHQVTVLTTDPENDPNLTNLTEVDLHSSYEVWDKHFLNMVNAGINVIKLFQTFFDFIYELMDVQMNHPTVQKLINDPSQKFDLVMVESLASLPAMFSNKFNCPLIVLSIPPMLECYYSVVGIPIHPVLYPDPLLPFDKPETVLERITSVIQYTFMYLLLVPFIDRKYNEQIWKYFGEEFGTTNEIMQNISMIFINEHPVLDGPRPVGPGLVYIRGIHKQPSKPLPEALKAILDSANEGFIYFSLGTNVKSKDIAPNTRKIIIDTFAELPYKILWKFELDSLENKPDNVIISKWFPQSDVLKHPNIKLFITHGGLASMDEAIHARVPMIAIPYFGDQTRNVRKMVRKGIALSLDSATLEKDNFKNTIHEVIENPKYRNAIGDLSDLMDDQPMTGLDKAVWWTEYVLRHKGATHLRSPLLDISWSQYLFLDVIICLLVAVVICVFLIIMFIRFIIKCFKKALSIKEKQL